MPDDGTNGAAGGKPDLTDSLYVEYIEEQLQRANAHYESSESSITQIMSHLEKLFEFTCWF